MYEKIIFNIKSLFKDERKIETRSFRCTMETLCKNILRVNYFIGFIGCICRYVLPNNWKYSSELFNHFSFATTMFKYYSILPVPIGRGILPAFIMTSKWYLGLTNYIVGLSVVTTIVLLCIII